MIQILTTRSLPRPGKNLNLQLDTIDEDGYVFVMGRVDDVINVAGHRLSTGQMEELIGSHPGVAECAAVSYTHLTLPTNHPV